MLQKRIRNRTLAALFALLLAQTASAEDRSREALVIAVVPLAEADPALLSRSLQIASEALSRAGVAQDAVLCSHATQPQCRARFDAERIWVRLKVESRGDRMLGPDASFGRAYLNRSGAPGAIADVFLDRIRAHAQKAQVDEAVLLGHVLAHEVGHLLLGRNSHPLSGLMSGKWDTRQLVQAGHGRLNFLDDEAVEMRRQVASRLEVALALN